MRKAKDNNVPMNFREVQEIKDKDKYMSASNNELDRLTR